MEGKRILQQTALYLKHQSPTILTCIGAAGVVLTAVTAAKATPKVICLLNEAEVEKREKLTKVETLIIAAPAYIPSALIGAATIACIFGANVLNQKHQAALTSAYMLLERSYKNYKNKVIELFGEETDKKIRTEIVKDGVGDTKFEERTGSDICIFYEPHYGSLFERSMLEVQHAEYLLNKKLMTEGEVCLNDFMRLLGLPKINGGEELGWSLEANCAWFGFSWIDFEHELVELTDDGLECYIIHISEDPTIGYNVPF